MTSSDSAEVLHLERDLPTTPEDVAVLRRLRASGPIGFAQYLAFLAALPVPSSEILRARPGPSGVPFDLLA